MSSPTPTSGSRRPASHILLPALLLICMLAASLLISREMANRDLAERQRQFDSQASQITSLLQARLDRLPQLLSSTRGMVINHDYQPSEQQWQRFFQSLALPYSELGIVGVTLTEYLGHGHRESFLARNRARYGKTFDIVPLSRPSAAPDEHYVIMQAAPESLIDSIRGYDIAAEPNRREAARQARQSGRIGITKPISLLSTDSHSLDYLMLAPLNGFRGGADSDERFAGWVTIGFSLSMLIEQTLAALDNPIRIQIRDPRIANHNPSYDNGSGMPSNAQLRLASERILKLSHEPLQLRLLPGSGSPLLQGNAPYHFASLTAGLLISLLASIALQLTLNARHNALQLAERMLERSRESRDRFQALFEQSPEAVLIHIDRRVVLSNHSALQLLGASEPTELLGRDVLSMVHPESLAHVESRLQELSRKHRLPPAEQRLLRLDGSDFMAEISSAQISYDGKPAIQVMFRDISAAKESRKQALIAQRVLEHTSEAIMVTDAQGDIVLVNPAFSELTGYHREQVLGRRPSLLASGHHTQTFFRQLWQSLFESGQWLGEIANRRRSGEIYIQKTNISAVFDEQGQISHFVCLMSDITEQKKLLDSIRFQAMHDNLTKLPNRINFESRAEKALRRAQQQGELFALLFIDLDGFKPINDCHGHRIGDKLLVALADKLSAAVRPGDTVARLGGDEFLILAEQLPGPQQAQQLAERVLAVIGTPLRIDDIELRLAASIGIASYPRHGDTISQLIDRADKAMYQAKQQGKGRIQLAAAPQ